MSWGSSTFKINHQVPQGSHLQFHRHQCHHHLLQHLHHLHHDQPATKWSSSWQPFYFRGFGRHEDSNIRGKGLDLPLTARFSSIILSIILSTILFIILVIMVNLAVMAILLMAIHSLVALLYCKSLPFSYFLTFEKGRLLYIFTLSVGRSVGRSVDVTINFFNV